MKKKVDAFLVLFLALTLGAALAAPLPWIFMAAPGSHALDRGHEPSLWLTNNERGFDPWP